MGVSSSRLPCQPPASTHLPTPEPQHSPPLVHGAPDPQHSPSLAHGTMEPQHSPSLVHGAPEPQYSPSQYSPSLTHEALEQLPTLERLAQATGGTEESWRRCVLPCGLISLVMGAAGTGVTFTFNTLQHTRVASLALLTLGTGALLLATGCWRRSRRRRKQEDML
ncbi:transmembrane protein 100-like [Danio aesculapii]|uniref:transmembrane protein 100-like n=1 Tax=Danio aesculapii TaxID=1142201 RepID=UPI0024C0D86E|nr:transmembrane protein 100-like [Danio aesculapii]